MAFTDSQRDAIMRYLGYPAVDAGTRYAAYYPVYSQIDLIGGSATTQAPVDAILTELAAVDVVLATAATTTSSSGDLKQVDEIHFYPTSESTTSGGVGAMSRARMLVKRLAQRMGGEELIVADYFGAGGFSLGGVFPAG